MQVTAQPAKLNAFAARRPVALRLAEVALILATQRSSWDRHLYNVTSDPEGVLSTIPSIATTLVGVLTGDFLLCEKLRHQGNSHVAYRSSWLGQRSDMKFLGSHQQELWTSSFALFTGGFALVFLAFLYWVLEIKQWRGPSIIPIIVFGMNAIPAFFVFRACWSRIPLMVNRSLRSKRGEIAIDDAR